MWIIGSLVPNIVWYLTLKSFNPSAITITPFVFSRHPPTPELYRHETTHIIQELELFSVTLLITLVLFGYFGWMTFLPAILATPILYSVFNVIGFLIGLVNLRSLRESFPRYEWLQVVTYYAWYTNPMEREAIYFEKDPQMLWGSHPMFYWVKWIRPSNWHLNTFRS
jgi:hypothetical protein